MNYRVCLAILETQDTDEAVVGAPKQRQRVSNALASDCDGEIGKPANVF
ncbi:hypothetical protein ACSFBM_28295 [Variovorax sp. GB1R11]